MKELLELLNKLKITDIPRGYFDNNSNTYLLAEPVQISIFKNEEGELSYRYNNVPEEIINGIKNFSTFLLSVNSAVTDDLDSGAKADYILQQLPDDESLYQLDLLDKLNLVSDFYLSLRQYLMDLDDIVDPQEVTYINQQTIALLNAAMSISEILQAIYEQVLHRQLALHENNVAYLIVDLAMRAQKKHPTDVHFIQVMNGIIEKVKQSVNSGPALTSYNTEHIEFNPVKNKEVRKIIPHLGSDIDVMAKDISTFITDSRSEEFYTETAEIRALYQIFMEPDIGKKIFESKPKDLIDKEEIKHLAKGVKYAFESKHALDAVIAIHAFNAYVMSTLGRIYDKEHLAEKLQEVMGNELKDLTVEPFAYEVTKLANQTLLKKHDIQDANDILAQTLKEYVPEEEDQSVEFRDLARESLNQGFTLFNAIVPLPDPQKILQLYTDQEQRSKLTDASDELINHIKHHETDYLIAGMVSTVPLNQVVSVAAQMLPSNEVKPFEKRYGEYLISHAYQVHQAQLDMKMGAMIAWEAERELQTELDRREKGRTVLDPQNPIQDALNRSQLNLANDIKKASDEICKDFINNVMHIIENNTWKTKFRYTTVNDHKLPIHIGEIYRMCLRAAEGNYAETFNEIARIGMKASEKKPGISLGFVKINFRDQETQKFYDLFKEAFVDAQALIEPGKSKGS